MVEQWACSRSHPTFTIATFTGHPAHKIFAGVLSILADETEWGEELTNYFRFIRQYGRQKETPFGSLTVTNLNNFPSDLTVIAVPEGDVLQHREHFIVNEDLKRMGCGGRSALTLTVPTDASQAKFHGLFRLSDRIPFHSAVIELVKLSQQALVMFKNLGKHFADGLLCDETVKAIQRWWIEFGTDFYNIEPSDGILGPTTVSGLLGMVIGARNRLSSCGAPVPKDAFDLPQLKVAIGYFQKQHKLPRTRRLDRDTIHKLHQITAKIASAERYGMVHKAIKSTVAEMSGKNQKVEMETCDIEKFIENLSGERAKYLWYGKPRKSTISTSAGVASSVDGSTGRRNSAPMSGPSSRVGTGMSGRGLTVITGPYSSKNEEPDATGDSSMSHPQSFPMSAPVSNTGHYSQESKDHLRKAMFKTMTGRMNDAKSGLGKIKDVATGLSGQVVKRHTRTKTYDLSYPEGSSAKSAADVDDGANGSIPNSAPSPGLDALKTTSLSLPNVNAATSTLATPEPPGSELHSNTQIPIFIQDDGSKIFSESPTTSIPKNPFLSASGNLNAPKSDYKEGVSPRSEYVDVEQLFRDNLKKQKKISDDDAADGIPGTMNTSMNNSVNAFEDARERLDGLPTADSSSGPFKAGAAAGSYLSVLNRSQSFSRVIERNYVTRNEEHWPRRMSFGEAEEAILIWNNIIPDEDVDNVMDAKISPRALRYSVLDTEQTVGEWTSRQVESVEVGLSLINICIASPRCIALLISIS